MRMLEAYDGECQRNTMIVSKECNESVQRI